MKNNVRSSLWLALALAAVLALSGCGSSTTSSPPAATSTPAVSNSDGSDTTQSNPSDSTGATGKTVSLGPGILPQSIIIEPNDGVTPIADAIRNSKKSVWLTMYELTNKTLIAALEYAHGNGVDVRVLLEKHPYGAASINKNVYNTLQAADIAVHWTPARFALTHEKGMLVDGSTAYIMSSNFTLSAFKSNREFDVVDTNPVDVAAVSAIFSADWDDRPYVPTAIDLNLPLSPTTARPLITALIRSAHKTLDIYSEEMQDKAIISELIAAQNRGVTVRVILPAPKGGGTDANSAGADQIRSAGVGVTQLSTPYIHAKLIIADRTRAFIGSQNFSASSLDKNRELGVIVRDPSAIATLESTFETDFARHGSVSSGGHRTRGTTTPTHKKKKRRRKKSSSSSAS